MDLKKKFVINNKPVEKIKGTFKGIEFYIDDFESGSIYLVKAGKAIGIIHFNCEMSQGCGYLDKDELIVEEL